MSRVVALVQARMGSTRFPGKMLAKLGDDPVISWVLQRVSRARLIDKVVLVTTTLDRDDPLVELAENFKIEVFRGSEDDVLGRFIAAIDCDSDIVVRICADNPFVDPIELDRLIEYYKHHECDYACNHQARLGSRYADGFGAEILSVELLRMIDRNASGARHREHVTSYLWENADIFSLHSLTAPSGLAFPDLRFDVDTPSDLERLSEVVRAGVCIDSSALEIINVFQTMGCNTPRKFSVALRDEFATYFQRLFPLCRSITGNANRETLKILQEIIPLTIVEVPSGTHVYDWIIPDEWNIRDAWISDLKGRRIVDFRDSNLHVVGYSEPIDLVMDWEGLKDHIHVHPDLPDAIPYRTSYYKRSWGFCVTHSQFIELEKEEGSFHVVIDADLKPGALTYGEFLIPGSSSKEILLSCYICHPSMANDSLSGVLLTAFLARQILKIKSRRWSYRIIFVPETIGAIAYCAINEGAMKKIDFGLVITTVGGPGSFSYKQSWNSSHFINSMIERVFFELGEKFITYPFDIHGSDERQYSSQGFRLNIATICRDRYYEYPYYHSSLDDLNFVSPEQVAETLVIYQKLIEEVEALKFYRSTSPYCEVMLSRHGLYPEQGGAMLPQFGGRSELDIILWLLFLCDGSQPIQHIAQKLNVSVAELEPMIKNLIDSSILEEV